MHLFFREKQPPRLNGPIEPIPHAGHIWHPCLHQQGTIPSMPYHHPIPSAYPQVFTYPFHDGGDIIPGGGQELSPSNSECSSPSPSPHLLHMAVRKQHLQPSQTDSSSDDGERGNDLSHILHFKFHSFLSKWISV